MSQRRAVIAGAAVVPFGRHVESTATELGRQAVTSLLDSTGVDPGQVQIGFGGSTYSGSLIAQRVLQRSGISKVPVFSVENACASGASAIHLARQAVLSGDVDVAVAFGVEHLSSLGGGALPLTGRDIEIEHGVVMPAIYAMRAKRYQYETGASDEALAHVAVKNRLNGADNPRAHFQKPVSVEDVLGSRPVSDPLTLLQCCANSDGAAAVLVTSEGAAADLGLPTVAIRASIVRSGDFHNEPRDMTWPDITYRTVKAAYEAAQLDPTDLDIVELHDAFSVAELLHVEAMGLTERGRAHIDLAEGQFDRNGRVAVSPSGGLLSRGHPVGATGVTQVAESYWQLTGTAGDLQVPGARIAMTHVTGGGIFGVDNAACSVHILEAT